MSARVLVGMSGGVDSSVAAAVLRDAGHEVVGVTMKLWGGASDTGCCSVADVDDARRAADRLGVEHHVFNFGREFDTHVVGPYVAAHERGETPNPCVECNRHLKFGALLARADRLGFDAVATGHHARITTEGGRFELRRGADRAKDQSYVLAVLGQAQLARVQLPVGELTKAEVREEAARLGLRTAAKPDSQDVCFVTSTGGREAFLSPRIGLHPGRLVDADTGAEVGTVPAVELVTVGQRRGMGGGGRENRRYALSVDVATATVVVGTEADARAGRVAVDPTSLSWVDTAVPAGAAVLAQSSAHGTPVAGVWEGDGVRWDEPQRRVAPGQTVALYDGDRVLGAGLAA